jgi:hypothetical protein
MKRKQSPDEEEAHKRLQEDIAHMEKHKHPLAEDYKANAFVNASGAIIYEQSGTLSKPYLLVEVFKSDVRSSITTHLEKKGYKEFEASGRRVLFEDGNFTKFCFLATTSDESTPIKRLLRIALPQVDILLPLFFPGDCLNSCFICFPPRLPICCLPFGSLPIRKLPQENVSPALSTIKRCQEFLDNAYQDKVGTVIYQQKTEMKEFRLFLETEANERDELIESLVFQGFHPLGKFAGVRVDFKDDDFDKFVSCVKAVAKKPPKFIGRFEASIMDAPFLKNLM